LISSGSACGIRFPSLPLDRLSATQRIDFVKFISMLLRRWLTHRTSFDRAIEIIDEISAINFLDYGNYRRQFPCLLSPFGVEPTWRT
jgi:hypothetical protein